MGPKAEPTTAAPRLMARAVMLPIAQAATQHHEHGHEGNDLFLHVLEPPEGGEGHADRNDHRSWPSRPPHERGHEAPQSARGLQKRERAAHEEDDDDHVRARNETPRHREQRRLGSHGRGLHGSVGSRHDHFSSGGRVLTPLVLARRDDPGQGRGHPNRAKKEDERMGKADTHIEERGASLAFHPDRHGDSQWAIAAASTPARPGSGTSS